VLSLGDFSYKNGEFFCMKCFTLLYALSGVTLTRVQAAWPAGGVVWCFSQTCLDLYEFVWVCMDLFGFCFGLKALPLLCIRDFSNKTG
jgi:hypothetical protein